MKKSEIYALSEIKGIGPKAVLKIIRILKKYSNNSIKDIDLSILLNDKGLYRYRNIIKDNFKKDIFERHEAIAFEAIHKIETAGIKVISIGDNKYPFLLKLIPDPPLLLFCKGDTSLLEQANNVAVVGTRKNTALGELITRKTVDFLCSNNYAIVSGLAYGIDTIAHDQTLKNHGKTISVLVDVENIHPKTNTALANKIVDEGGLLLAEVAPGTPTIPQLFVKRDRIQCGLSLAVFPIETTIKGGTRHAVLGAEKQKRLVYAPDVHKSGYKNKNIPQLEGIKDFIQNNKAEPYTKETYNKILHDLALKQKDLDHARLSKEF